MATATKQKRGSLESFPNVVSNDKNEDVLSYQHFVKAEAETPESFTADEAQACREVMERLGVREADFAEHVAMYRRVLDAENCNQRADFATLEADTKAAFDRLRELETPQGNPLLKAKSELAGLRAKLSLKKANEQLVTKSRHECPLVFATPEEYYDQQRKKAEAA